MPDLQLQYVNITKFKSIESCKLDLKPVTLLIGGNNAGKSSILQGIHFALTAVQASQDKKTLAEHQFLYRPCFDLHNLRHRSPLTQKNGMEFSFAYRDTRNPSELKYFNLVIKRGKNANLSLTYDPEDALCRRLRDAEHPYSIFVPGLSGIPLQEPYYPTFRVRTGVAHGDANLFLRNVLYRLGKDEEKGERFHSLLDDIFEGWRVTCKFDENQSEYVDAWVERGETRISLERAGLGMLQAIQICAYVVQYQPSLILLDEPDAHLHPSNQRKMCRLIKKIANEQPVAFVVATHSRHLYMELQGWSAARVNVVQPNLVKPVSRHDAMDVLMHIGALDALDRYETAECVILTEDNDTLYLEVILRALKVTEERFVPLSYSGIGNADWAINAFPVFGNAFRSKNIVLQLDGDGLNDADCRTIEEHYLYKMRSKVGANTKCVVWLTRLNSIESYFCIPSHVAAVFGISDKIVQECMLSRLEKEWNAIRERMIEKQGSLKERWGRLLKRGLQLAIPEEVDIQSCLLYYDGKKMLRMIKDIARRETWGDPTRLIAISSQLAVEEIRKVFGDVLKTS